MRSRRTTRLQWVGVSIGVAATLSLTQPSHAATISWKGHTWNVTSGGMAGVCQGNAANISVDVGGYLHMKISKNGTTWTAAEIFSTDKIGFGTHQWQIEGPTDKLDKNVVVGLFPYGPEGGLGSSGNNEIDIEFARWGNAAWPNGNYTVWPPTGSTTGSHTFTFSLNGSTSITTRFAWSSTKIDFATLSGFVPVDASSGLIDSWTFAPANPTSKITQTAMPLGMNLWCYDNPPSDGQEVEIIVRDFQFLPLGAQVDGGAGGAGGAGGVGGSGGASDPGTRDASVVADATAGGGGAAGDRGTAGFGGTAMGGAAGSGGTGKGGAVGSGGISGGAGSGGTAVGGAAGSRSNATGGSVGAGGATGTGGSGVPVGTGGAGPGGTRSDGSGGAGLAGAGGSAGAGGGPGAAGGAGEEPKGGTTGGGGSSNTSGKVASASTDSGGCSCAIGRARASLGGHLSLLAIAALMARLRAKGPRPPAQRR